MTAIDIQKNNMGDPFDLLPLSRDIAHIRGCCLLFTVRNPVFGKNIVNGAINREDHPCCFYVFILRWCEALDFRKTSIEIISLADQLFKFTYSDASLENHDGWNPYSSKDSRIKEFTTGLPCKPKPKSCWERFGWSGAPPHCYYNVLGYFSVSAKGSDGL